MLYVPRNVVDKRQDDTLDVGKFLPSKTIINAPIFWIIYVIL